MGIEANILARQATEQIAGLADDEAQLHGPAVWEHLAAIVRKHVPPPVPVVLPASPLSGSLPRTPYQE